MLSPSVGELGVLAILMESILAMQKLVVPLCENPRPGKETTFLDPLNPFPGEVSVMPWRLHRGIINRCYEARLFCLNM